MKRNILLGSLATLVLAACGTGLIPAFPIKNALNIKGEQTTIVLGAAAAQATGNINVSATFNDYPDLNALPAIPMKFSLVLDIDKVDFGAGCPLTLPTSIDVSIPKITATVTDGSSSSQRSQKAEATNVKFTITKTSSGYMVDNISNDTLSFGNVGELVSILKAGGTNTGTLSAAVNTTSTPDLGNCAMTITWGSIDGSVQF